MSHYDLFQEVITLRDKVIALREEIKKLKEDVVYLASDRDMHKQHSIDLYNELRKYEELDYHLQDAHGSCNCSLCVG